jgi:alanyl-tRNA synthetase
MNAHELRKNFLKFFKQKKHTVVPSMSLIPRDDPSLLFTSAGMVQFKPLYTGTVPLPYKRAASVQKCLRTSDLENVGKTRRHHTFFEMLGNFSFGDYFKEEAIVWAWEYLLEVLSIDKNKLYVSVYEKDDEAYTIWHKKIGLTPDRIFRLGEDDNFWGPAGNSGPCGPCSEIFYDLGPAFSCGTKSCEPGCDCDRYPEIWNLVFPQFNQTVAGERLPLKNRGVDTGMGFERLLSILQNKDSNFHTDLFYPVIEDIVHIANIAYGADNTVDIATNVVADHLRALVFAIGDGIIPSNEERGYVLRRILRRAVRLCRTIGIEEAFLYKLVPRVVTMYETDYPDLKERREEITLVIKSEEERFLSTLEKGLSQLEQLFKRKKPISAKDAFTLYDTYGFPLELTAEMAKEKNINVDEKGFLNMLEKAREVSKAKAQFIPKGEWHIVQEGTGTFVGYDTSDIETEIIRYNTHDNIVELVLKESPFYAEAGGQVGDRGIIKSKKFKLTVLDTYWYQGMIVCHCTVQSGTFTPAKVHAHVDMQKRKESARAHTATHLLHAALRKTLGEHARQEGSYVEPGRFRFDFTHFKPLSDDEVSEIETLVNGKVLENLPVEKSFTTLDQAKKMGAMAIFGEKYGDEVRVVKIGDFSIELCGGIHLDSTGEIGLFKIMSQEAAAAGIRRVEAFVGFRLYEEMTEDMATIRELAHIFGADTDLIKKASATQDRIKALEKTNRENQMRLARIEAEGIITHARQEKTNIVAHQFKDFDAETIRMVADIVRAKIHNVAGLFYSAQEKKMNYVVFVGDDLVKQSPANTLIKDIGKIVGGGGGGKPHMAEGGGGNLEKVAKAVTYLKSRFGS